MLGCYHEATFAAPDHAGERELQLAIRFADRCYIALGRLQSKPSIVLGLSSAMFGFMLDALKGYDWRILLPIFISFGVGWFLLFLVYWAKDWHSGPSVDRIRWSIEENEAWAAFRDDDIVELDKEVQEARTRLKEMGAHFNWAVIFLIIAALGLAALELFFIPGCVSR